jgi:hypothetical protein
MDIQENISQLEQFRQELFEAFEFRSDALMELVDALSSTPNARSAVELSLSPLFLRSYNSVYDAIDNFFPASSDEEAREEHRAQECIFMRLIAARLPRPQRRKFWLFGIDVTPLPRPFAITLPDRTFVHQPNTIRGNKPIAIGHQYSALVAFPEKESETAPPWVVPLLVRRVTSKQTGNEVGAEQIADLLEDEVLSFHGDLCVQVADGAYSVVTFLGPVAQHENLLTFARLRSNRVLYRIPQEAVIEGQCGHPTWYGERFDLRDPNTWGEPDELSQTTHITRRRRTYTVHLEGWHNLLMRGTRDFPMHQHPFTLIRIWLTDDQGRPVFRRDLWLIVFGKRRREVSLVEAWEAYGRRYDVEHFFRFGKQRLLLAAYQTSDVRREENWWQIVSLAYVQLWLARFLVEAMPRPWERYLLQPKAGEVSPAAVQRDLGRIIRQIGTPTKPPKPRGKSPGRARGEQQPRRERQPVIKKGPKTRKKASQPV